MNWLPSFAAWQFAAAGAVAAAGPVLIHLLNRRRFRVVEWAAMDFLREALQRNRRVMQLRDLLLLLLRTVAIVLFGMALARPYYAYQEETFDGMQSLHAVLLIDNSLSMGYETIEGAVLARAKQRAHDFIDKLPRGSQVSVIPLCGSRFGFSPDPYQTKQYAAEALDRIEVVDRAASLPAALNAARDACQTLPQLAKRVVLFTDQQSANWERVSESDFPESLPPLQIVTAVSQPRDNSFVSDVRVQDHLADVETPATIVATIEHTGTQPRRNVQVRLEVNGEEVAAQSISQLEPGTREITFQHTFDGFAPQPGQPAFVPVAVSIPADRLPADDRLTRIVPVVAALPVVFIDQYNSETEDPVRRRLGETRHLRRLLAPASQSGERSQLIQIRHISADQLSREVLADARLAVLAGLSTPPQGATGEEGVELLRQFVQQGGQLVIATGGTAASGFDPARWNQLAWADGEGILPAPLEPRLVGALPSQVDEIKPFFLNYDSIDNHPYFRIAGTSDDALRALYSEPLFFQAVHANLDDEVLNQLRDTEVRRLRQLADFLAQYETRRSEFEQRTGTDPSTESLLQEDERRLAELQPNWLLWSSPDNTWFQDLPEDGPEREEALRKLAEQSMPVTIGRFSNEAATPFLVQRQIGKGRVAFVSTGVLAASEWNTLPRTNAFLIFDRILRTMIESTLPQRNYISSDNLNIALPRESRDLRIELQCPDDPGRERLQPGFIGSDQFGVTIDSPLQRGIYRLIATRPSGDSESDDDPVVWELPLSVSMTHGDEEVGESNLAPLPRSRFDQLAGNQQVFLVEPDQEISLAGAQIRGQNSWFYLVLAVLLVLLAELIILAWPAVRSRITDSEASTASTSVSPP